MRLIICNLHDLRWLPIRERIRFKTAWMCYREIRDYQPHTLLTYLLESACVRSVDGHWLRPIDTHSNTVVTWMRFSCAAPRVWNKLPLNIPLRDRMLVLKKLSIALFATPFLMPVPRDATSPTHVESKPKSSQTPTESKSSLSPDTSKSGQAVN